MSLLEDLESFIAPEGRQNLDDMSRQQTALAANCRLL
jgi:hypothetical protein